jgi:phosphatidylserine/phosphatidylglycerophosphate/cardiolipin synthase-like enzyme
MGIQHGNIEMYFGPAALGAPDDLERVITEFIDDARDTLVIAVQELESRAIAEAIVRAKQRRVRIKMVVEQDYLREQRPPADPFLVDPDDSLHENRELFSALLRAGVDVRADYNPHIFHQKFIVRDLNGSRRATLMGSTNFTPTGVGTHATKKNLNHVVIINDKRVSREYDAEFQEIWTGTFGEKRARHEGAPRWNRVSDVSMRAIFAPDHTPELEIMKQILKAKKRIDFAIFTFSQSSGIDDAIVARVRPTIPVRGIFDSSQGNQQWAATRIVSAAGAKAFLASNKQGLGKLHHKLMVIDDSLIICGSFNYTGPANRLNDENLMIIGDLEEDDADAKAGQRALALAARKEIDRIIDKHGVRVT